MNGAPAPGDGRAARRMPECVALDAPLQALHSLAAPCEAAALARLRRPGSLPALVAGARAAGLPLLPLGAGSNVVLARRLEALVVRQECRGIAVREDSRQSLLVEVAAGENWHELVAWSLRQGCRGLENLALIPGTVGAAPVQNIGAYGVELAAFVERVSAVDLRTCETLRLSREECRFGYRGSVFKGELADRVLITSVTLRLPRLGPVNAAYPALAAALRRAGIGAPTPRQVYAAVVAIRRARLPAPELLPNAGSFFGNPVLGAARAAALRAAWPELPMFPQADGSVRVAAAWLIEQCGFRERRDAVRVHARHALVIVNPERRSGSEILALAARIRAAVRERFGIELRQEPRGYGRF